MISAQPSVSVIVPAYNEEDYVASALESVRDQAYDNLELIVVPNGCTDATADVAERFTPHIYDTTKRGIGLAKNIGYEKALGEVVIFLDADSQMQQGLIEHAIQALQAKYVAGKASITPDDNSLPARLYFGNVNLMGRLSQALMYLNPIWNNGAGACIFSTHDRLGSLKRNDGHVFREDIKTMEDVDLISRLRREGPFKFVTKTGITTSTRRFDEDGYLKRFFMDVVEYANPAGISERKDIR